LYGAILHLETEEPIMKVSTKVKAGGGDNFAG
jgi:hypothetical protein